MSGFYGHLTGKTYDSIEAMRHYEGLEARRRCVPSEEEKEFDNLPAEKVLGLVHKAMRSEQQKAAEIQTSVDVEAFLKAYPEYLNNDYNAAVMTLLLEGQRINLKTATFYQLEQAFLSGNERGRFHLNPKAVKRQQEQVVDDRVKEIEQSRQAFNEADAYNMPMEEVRRRASQF